MNAVYFEQVEFELNYTEKFSGVTIDLANVTWAIPDAAVSGSFTNLGNGLWHTNFDTAEVGYGTWGFTFRALPDNPILAATTTTLTLTIKRIPTAALNPSPLTVVWGWQGNISFIYYDSHFETGVAGADTEYSWGPVKGSAIDTGNGTYLVPVDTTLLTTGDRHSVLISFAKGNYQESNGGIQIAVQEIPTEVVIQPPIDNMIEGSRTNLQVPIGDTLTVQLFYNDTDDTEGYIGGIEKALLLPESSFSGQTFNGKWDFPLVELAAGWYSFTFDTTNSSIYDIADWTPGVEYTYYVALQLENRTLVEVSISIRVVEIPAELIFPELDAQNPFVQFPYGQTVAVKVYYNDTWIGHSDSRGIEDATILGEFGEGIVKVDRVVEDGNGYYTVYLFAEAPLVPLGISEDLTLGTVSANKSTYSDAKLELRVNVIPTQGQQSMDTALRLGTPISLFIIFLLVAYIKVWSVPKRLRQINGQIKSLEKGKIPSPIDEAKSRQDLVAELFNDTFREVQVTRTPESMPSEAVEIEVPELGELLVMLSILTHLSPEELEDFKGDIDKMKPSEKAAFIKEVIQQEAIRAAKRENKDTDAIIEEVREEARKQLRGEEIEEEPEDIPEVKEVGQVERLLLEEEIPEKKIVAEEDEIAERESDFLSPYELEELRKDLEKRGVPAHEIDTIIKQAERLSRDLVRELLASLDENKE